MVRVCFVMSPSQARQRPRLFVRLSWISPPKFGRTVRSSLDSPVQHTALAPEVVYDHIWRWLKKQSCLFRQYEELWCWEFFYLKLFVTLFVMSKIWCQHMLLFFLAKLSRQKITCTNFDLRTMSTLQRPFFMLRAICISRPLSVWASWYKLEWNLPKFLLSFSTSFWKNTINNSALKIIIRICI